MNALGTVDIDFNLNGLLIPHVAIVIANLNDQCILGTDFLTATSAKIDFENGSISFEDDLVRMHVSSPKQNLDFVRVIKHTILPPNSESIIPVKVAQHFTDVDSVIEPRTPFGSVKFAVAKCLVRPQSSNTVCQILNSTDEPIILVRNRRIAVISKIECDDRLTGMATERQATVATISDRTQNDEESIELQPKLSKSQQDSFLNEYKFDINPELTEGQRDALINLLFEYRDIFSRNMKELGCYKNYEVELDTVSHKPFFIKQYRLPDAQKEIAQKEIDDMVQCGLLEPNPKSHYNSPYLLIRKSDGSYRVVVDLRRGANMVCRSWTFNSKSVSEVIEDIASSNSLYYSSFDCYKGFWQLALSKRSRDLITITAPNQQRLSATRLPMGANISSSEFNRALHTALQNELLSSLSIYVDDISIYNATFNEHMNKLLAVFKLLRANGLTMSPKKCRLAYHDIKMLGFKIGPNGVEICSDKVKALLAMQYPKNQKSLRRFLGMANFFRTHIKNFSQRTSNLRRLLRKNEPWKFTEECKSECEDIKKTLASPDVLMAIRPNEDFFVDIDASGSGFGWIIYQRDPRTGQLRPVYFGSASATDYQKKYSSANSELQGLFLAVKSMQHHFIGQRVFVMTDSVTVQFLNSLHLQSNRHKRIAAYLQSFDLRLLYRPGKQNNAADYFSRYFDDMDKAERVKFEDKTDDDDLICSITETANNNVGQSVSENIVENELTTTGHCCEDVDCNHSLCKICNQMDTNDSDIVLPLRPHNVYIIA